MSETLNAWFNSFVDLSGSVFARLAELPVVYVTVLLLIALTIGYLAWRGIRRLRGKVGPSARPYVVTMVVVFMVGVVFLLDKKLTILRQEIGDLQFYVRAQSVKSSGQQTEAAAAAPAVAEPASAAAVPAAAAKQKPKPKQEPKPKPKPLTHRLIDKEVVDAGLKKIFSSCETSFSIINPAMEFASFRDRSRSPAACFITIIDLTNPGVEIAIDDELGKKYLTTEFAKEHDCVVAINGEAGMSPSRTAPLGRYTGLCISKGKKILTKSPHKRPFLSFDRKNRARYFEDGTEDPEITDDMYNVIWGRDDLLNDGEFKKASSWRWGRANPRTLMGIDAEGTRLVLMVVDGRRRGYSVGLDLKRCARVLELFGVRHAMRCDQGGSSMMYLKSSGIVSRPSDGKERPTYTHFGIKYRGG